MQGLTGWLKPEMMKFHTFDVIIRNFSPWMLPAAPWSRPWNLAERYHQK
jgi:hypothetical protein